MSIFIYTFVPIIHLLSCQCYFKVYMVKLVAKVDCSMISIGNFLHINTHTHGLFPLYPNSYSEYEVLSDPVFEPGEDAAAFSAAYIS